MKRFTALASPLLLALLFGANSVMAYDYDLSRPYHDPSEYPVRDVSRKGKRSLKDFEDRSLELTEVQSGIDNLGIFCPKELAEQAQLPGRLFEGRPALRTGDIYVIKGNEVCVENALNFISFKPVDLERNILDIRLGHVEFGTFARGNPFRTRSDYRNASLQHELTLRVTCTHRELDRPWTEDYFVCPLLVNERDGSSRESGYITFKVSAWNGTN